MVSSYNKDSLTFTAWFQQYNPSMCFMSTSTHQQCLLPLVADGPQERTRNLWDLSGMTWKATLHTHQTNKDISFSALIKCSYFPNRQNVVKPDNILLKDGLSTITTAHICNGSQAGSGEMQREGHLTSDSSVYALPHPPKKMHPSIR